ncbi:MAG: hypothetical protein JSW59_07310 [Phycisphaerales bacterium]|nr:MAG: hypothetical protein JSW59_07310 [Phycisphaerales bacterium]
MKKRSLFLTCALSGMLFSGTTKSSEPTAAELIRAARASENWLHEIDSLYIRIESTSTKTAEGLAARRSELRLQHPDGPLEADRFVELKPVTTAILEYAIDESRVRFLSDQHGSQRDLKIWDGTQLIFHEASLLEKHEQVNLDRTPHGYFQDMLASDTSWPRAQPHAFWWDDKDLDAYLSYYGRAEDASLTGRCDYRGVDCYVLDVRPKGIPGLVIVQSYPGCKSCQRRQYGLIGQARGLAGQSYRWYVGVEDRRLHGLMWLSNNKSRVEYWMSDYKEVRPGCWLPMTQGCDAYAEDTCGPPYVDVHTDLKVVDVRINEELPDELFEMKLEEGVKVVDSRRGRTRTYTYKPDPPDLVGKILPEFADIGVNFTPEQTRRVLICFWDIQQRPSRHYITKLAEKAGVLADKGVTVLCVHASGAEAKTVDEWMRDFNIPFPAKTMAEDLEKARYAWGVKSLPWLILTDKNHIVRAEGFGPSELDTKIGEITTGQ